MADQQVTQFQPTFSPAQQGLLLRYILPLRPLARS
jgi:hypothetical protein